MAKGTTSMGKMVLQGALAAVLITAGLAVFFPGRGEELMKEIGNLFGNNQLRNIVMYILAVIEIVAGVLLILDFFHIKSLDRIDDLALLAVIIAWLVFIVMADILPLVNGRVVILKWINQLGMHVLVLASMIIIKAKI